MHLYPKYKLHFKYYQVECLVLYTKDFYGNYNSRYKRVEEYVFN
jgi:hypothetical protein